MVSVKIRNATITTSSCDDTRVELQHISDIMIGNEDIKELLSDNLYININVVRAFCNHFKDYTPTINTPEEHAKIEMAFKLISQLIKTDVLDNLTKKEKDNG